MKKLLLWIVWNIPLGPLAPWVFGLAIGRMPEKEAQAPDETADS